MQDQGREGTNAPSQDRRGTRVRFSAGPGHVELSQQPRLHPVNIIFHDANWERGRGAEAGHGRGRGLVPLMSSPAMQKSWRHLPCPGLVLGRVPLGL